MSPLFYLSSSFVFLVISFEAESSWSTNLQLPRLKTGLSRSCTSEGNLSSTIVALSGTGHRLYVPSMLQQISQEEACYSHCFSKVPIPLIRWSIDLPPAILYNERVYTGGYVYSDSYNIIIILSTILQPQFQLNL